MTEKRFSFGYIDGVKILKDNDRFVPDVEALELLNALYDENEQLKQSIDYHLNVCKNEKKKITDLYNWGIPQRHSKSVSSELVLKYIGAIEVLEQIKKELKGDVE